MKWTGLNELRESYLSFFEDKGHLRLKSAPLVPQGDSSILLINAGMTPLKKYFQGIEAPPRRRMTSCQKCVRVIDIENVGFTSRHGTYFEMLGNFSFGDYFKEEAIAWSWEFLTKTLEIPEALLYPSVYVEDKEAEDIWVKIGIPREKITRLGKADNFWEHGSGPCGPCSEIYFDRGVEHGCESPDCAPGCDCDRFIEVWNNVFTQFDSDGKGNYAPLENKNIDTGMGLERLACVIQGVDSLFEVDTVQKIMQKVCSITGKVYKQNKKEDISIRIITDHIRSATFIVCDGVRPSNEGRGYVLRRLLRRAARHGRLLGFAEPFLCEVCEEVIEENKAAYPELVEKRDYIKKIIRTEEESFARTVENGLQILGEYIEALPENGVLDGEKAFKLHDTYGFPLDLTKEILSEKGMSVDTAEFDRLMKIQRDTARKNQAFKGGWDEAALGAFSGFTTHFVGYKQLSCAAKILAMVKDGKPADELSEGESGAVLIDTTPFYAESGGQAGDTGLISSGDNLMRVLDTKKLSGGSFVCTVEVVSGSFYAEDEVTAEVDGGAREATMRNHTSAHLLQAALREVLGEHIHQAGSYVDPHRCRFDFSHFSALTAEELEAVEALVNRKILEGLPVTVEEMPIEQAQKRGAMALFGEKYGDIVRVVDVPGFSMEFCGGTHLDNTAKAGLFKIISEVSVAAGVRRIEAVTGLGVLHALEQAKRQISGAAGALKLGNPALLVPKCEAIAAELQELGREAEKLRSQLHSSKMRDLMEIAVAGKFTLITADLPGVTGDDLRNMGVTAAGDTNCFIAVFAGHEGGKGNFLCVCDKGAIEAGAHAGNIVREIAAITGGKGGGKPDIAMAGIADVGKVGEALAALPGIALRLGGLA